ncbi:MAG: glutamate--cysteine ligase, partial [Candidatus Binatota bacterium]
MSPIRNKEELEEFFHSSGKPRRQWRVGTEYEKVGIERRSGKAIPYSGPRGVEAILRALIEEYGWEPQEDDGHVIALIREKAQIHLEPGGQIELA